MYLSDPSKFTHRRNADGTFDSICLKCFIMVESVGERKLRTAAWKPSKGVQ